jgi:hypothetical protein
MQCIFTSQAVSTYPRVLSLCTLHPEVRAEFSTFMFFLGHSRKLFIQYLKLDLNRFLSSHWQFTSHPVIRRYLVWANKSAFL